MVNLLKNNKGFTLIELMIVVVVIAILAAIAYPSYTQYKIRTNRAEVQTEMVRIAQSLQSFKTVNHSYNNAKLDNGLVSISFPNAGAVNYAISLAVDVDNQGYLLTATPNTSSTQKGNGALTINQTNQQCWFKNKDVPTSSDTCSSWSDR